MGRGGEEEGGEIIGNMVPYMHVTHTQSSHLIVCAMCSCVGVWFALCCESHCPSTIAVQQ